MATYTTNYELTKPEYSERADIGVINADLDAIDELLKSNADATATAQGVATAAQSLANDAKAAADNALTADSTLNAAKLSGEVPSACMPSYVDDVLEAYVVGSTALAANWLSLTQNGSPLTPEAGKIYVVVSSGTYYNKTYRWTGSAYVCIDNPLDIATTAEATAGTNDAKAMTPLKTRQAIAAYPVATSAANGLMAASDKLVLAEHEYDNLVACNTYGGRSIAALFPTEVAAAGSVWQFLHNRIAAQNFAGLRIGDWFDVPLTTASGKITKTSVRYCIYAFDHYYNCSDQAIAHHIVCGPTAPVEMTGSSYATNTSYIMWNTTATNQGTSAEPNPYLNSNLHKWEINEYLTMLPSSLQSLLLNHRSLCESRYSASGSLSASTGWAWKSLGKIWSPSEMEVYGCSVWGTPGYSQGMDSQFPYFRETKDRIKGGRVGWWLRVVSGSSASHVCVVYNDGTAYSSSATHAWIRPLPCFLLG